jgi:osmotically-inducible protein OsmY
MRIQMTSLGLPAALLAASLFGACSNTAKGVEQDTEQNAAKAKVATADATAATARATQDTKLGVEHAAEATKDAAADAVQATKNGAERAAEATKDAASQTGKALDGAAQTMVIKSALIADKSVEAVNINVDTDGTMKVVTLKGTVPSPAQKTAAGRIAKEKAPDYKIVNNLVVKATS